MSFLFPANPANGDIVVQPQPDGSFIKGTYDEATNTWAVGELPEEPGVPGPAGPKGDQGDKGNPGKGIAISGVVDTESNLPPANNHIFQFYIVDDVNQVFYSDGFQWFDLGGPIVGPQGEPGLDGTNGTDGLNGAPGKGWTSTTIIDERPTNYQVRFNSDDNLGFVTDNIMGPRGETGSLAVATPTTIGGIKIGRGLNISPEGTVSAGETNVDLETVPLTPEGTVYNYSYNLGFQPEFLEFNNSVDYSYYFTSNSPQNNFANSSIQWTPPETATGCMVYFFRSSQQKLTGNWSAGTLVTPKVYIGWNIAASRGVFQGSGAASFATGNFHNLVFSYNNTTQANQMVQWLPGTKVEQLEFGAEQGTITFDLTINLVDRAQWSQGLIGPGRLILIPYRGDPDINAVFARRASSIYTDPSESQRSEAQLVNTLIGPALLEDISATMTNQINVNITTIVDLLSTETDPAKIQQLNDIKDLYLGIPDQPGTPEELQALIWSYNALLYPFTETTYRFQL